MKIPAISFFKFGSFWYTNFFLIALGYYFYGESVRETQEKLESETKLQSTLLKLRDAELENLKAQLNPHFLFNTLWYIIGLVQATGSKDATKAIQLLSGMMRYSMESRKVGEFVPLVDEIKYVKDFIDLYRLRMPMIKLEYQVDSNTIEDIKVLPLVLLSFVENAIKHGKLDEESNPLVVHLIVDKNKSFTFFVKNRISTLGRERSSGIGLENTKSRLETAYGTKHKLIIENDEENYSSKLIIQI